MKGWNGGAKADASQGWLAPDPIFLSGPSHGRPGPIGTRPRKTKNITLMGSPNKEVFYFFKPRSRIKIDFYNAFGVYRKWTIVHIK